MPRLDDVWALLFSSMGLLVLCPVVACGVVGLLGLWRERRADAAVALAVCVVFTLYPAGLKTSSAFGGLGPPRYLVALLPFAALGLAPALRAFPRTTLALGAVSIFQMALLTATGPLAAYDGRWLDRATDRIFVQTAASVVGVTGWYTIVPFFAAVAVAAASTVRLLPQLRADPLDLALAVARARCVDSGRDRRRQPERRAAERSRTRSWPPCSPARRRWSLPAYDRP